MTPDGRREFALGDLVSSEERIVVFALSVLPLPAVDGRPVASLEGEQLVEIELAYDALGQAGITSRTFTQVIRIQSTQDPANVVVNTQVIPWVALQRAGQVMKTAVERLDAGQEEAALKLLRECHQGLGAYGSVPGVEEARQNLEQIIHQVERREWDNRSRKSSRYRSSTYRKVSSRDFWSAESPAPSFKQTPPPPAPPVPPVPPAASAPPATPPSGPTPSSGPR